VIDEFPTPTVSPVNDWALDILQRGADGIGQMAYADFGEGGKNFSRLKSMAVGGYIESMCDACNQRYIWKLTPFGAATLRATLEDRNPIKRVPRAINIVDNESPLA
jgi:hypothetical protein